MRRTLEQTYTYIGVAIFRVGIEERNSQLATFSDLNRERKTYFEVDVFGNKQVFRIRNTKAICKIICLQ